MSSRSICKSPKAGVRITKVVVLSRGGTSYKYDPSILYQFQLQASTCSYIDECVLRCTTGHIPKYMGWGSNNNKMLLNNSLCCFAIGVVYIQITIMWSIWYIDKGFLVWIIPSTYLSHKIIIWIVPLVLSYLLSLDIVRISGFIIINIIIILYIFISWFFTCILLFWFPILPYCTQPVSYWTLHLYYCT